MKIKNKSNIFMEMTLLNQPELWDYVCNDLTERNIEYITTESVIFAKGTVPILLLAHLDTARDAPKRVKNIDNILFTTDGTGYCLGADDRAGVHAMLHFLSHKKDRPHMIFTTDEEWGCVGTESFLKSEITTEIAEILEKSIFFIQIDRRGKDDCVFYSDEDKTFISYVESFGFKEAIGSFSDVACFADYFDICGTNLSAGYYDEHSAEEILVYDYLLDTIRKCSEIIDDVVKNEVKQFTLPKNRWTASDKRYGYVYGNYTEIGGYDEVYSVTSAKGKKVGGGDQDDKRYISEICKKCNYWSPQAELKEYNGLCLQCFMHIDEDEIKNIHDDTDEYFTEGTVCNLDRACTSCGISLKYGSEAEWENYCCDDCWKTFYGETVPF